MRTECVSANLKEAEVQGVNYTANGLLQANLHCVILQHEAFSPIVNPLIPGYQVVICYSGRSAYQRRL